MTRGRPKLMLKPKERYKRVHTLNRIAAARYRKRKKEEKQQQTEKTRQRVEQLKIENEEIENKINLLKREMNVIR